MVNTITIEEALNDPNVQFFDTRSPKEFEHDHLPNAINIPILSNDERAVVGTLYKQVSQDKAISQGMEYVATHMSDIVKKINLHKSKKLVIYCWRGGMRSGVIVSFLEALKYDVYQLKGGHKSFRKYVKERLENYELKPKVIILWGLTCVGKTDLLNKFHNSIDIEGLAQHNGSLYGAMGKNPHSQYRFDNLLLRKLDSLQNEKCIITEGESRRIGDLMIPAFFYKKMLNGIHIFLTRSIEKRAQLCAAEYINSTNKEEAIKISASLNRVIGKKKQTEMVNFIEKEDFFSASKILLEDYYDPLYQHTLKQFNYSFEINTDDMEKAKEELEKFVDSI
ncbi:MAG: tRNA 2-selenouridine(34) synthase MnmH [Candidatus Woesearchaeota archaeon]